jgi:plastocyanin
MRRRTAIGLIGALALTACGADRDDSLQSTSTVGGSAATPTTPTTPTTPATRPRWTLQSWEFVTDLVATAGEPIEVLNADGADHTLTDVDGSFEAYVEADGSTMLTIDRPGTYAVWCRIHPDMRGTVVVEAVP